MIKMTPSFSTSIELEFFFFFLSHQNSGSGFVSGTQIEQQKMHK